MSFQDLFINYSYETGKDDPINEFYIPVLSSAIKYDRIAGFFSSASLAIAARGIAGLIRNGGKMRLLASPYLTAKDIQVMTSATEKPEDYIENILLTSIESFQDDFQKDHVQALGWMLANKYLEIKIVYVKYENSEDYREQAIFHQKVGILEDSEGNLISFSGSVNETAAGWLNNIEEIKVFKSWIDGQDAYLEDDKNKFDGFWEGTRREVVTLDLSSSLKAKLLRLSNNFDKDDFLAKSYAFKKKSKTFSERLNLFFYQADAVKMWIDNNYMLLFEMATGTGKTRTAIACISEALKKEKNLVVVIATPQGTLSKQWKTEIEEIGLEFSAKLIADSSNSVWRKELNIILKKVQTGYYSSLIIYTTHITLSSNDFINILSNQSTSITLCLVGDEAHGLGAYKTKNSLLNAYKYRIGLSATPKRWFDDYGSDILTEYFGNRSYCFTIKDAQREINPLTNKPFLVNYYYYPVFIELSDDELYEYQKLTNRIKKLGAYNKTSDDYQKRLENLLFMRADIEKNASNKLKALDKLIDEMNSNDQAIQDIIIFTSDKQIDDVMQLLTKKNITSHRFTQRERTTKESQYNGLTERQFLIRKFRDSTYKILVAIKCLNEGIDIPSASTAILMSSSTNPREYIQRIGRVIRQAPNKSFAYIYDFIIEPSLDRVESAELIDFEKMIFYKELNRVRDMASNAINNAQVFVEISNKERMF